MAYSKADQKLINENPGKQPYELLALGMSQPGYDRMIAENEKVDKANEAAVEKAAKAQPAKGKEEDAVLLLKEDVPIGTAENPKAKLMPVPKQNNKVGPATIVGPTGIRQKMNRILAENLARRNPNQYRIID